jgi:hypothetical protein
LRDQLNLECLRELELDMCGNCEFYDKDTAECKATIKQIKEINKKYNDE